MSESIQIKPGEYEDVMPDMSGEEFEALKQSIERDGLRHPIEVTEDGVIIDGHHRFKACEELGVEPEFTVVEEPSVEQAIRSNFTRRNLSDGTKREVVRNYLVENYTGGRSTDEIAEELGVSGGTVRTAKNEAEGVVNPSGRDWFSTEEKRHQVADYLEANPDASNREAARSVEADVSHPTVGEWRTEWEEEVNESAEPDPVAEPGADGRSEADDEPDSDPDPETDAPEPEEEPDGETPDTDATERQPVAVVDPQPEPEQADEASGLDPHPMDENGEGPGQSASERQLRRQLNRKNGRIEELEAVIREFIRAVENQDPDGIRETAERAEELVAV